MNNKRSSTGDVTRWGLIALFSGAVAIAFAPIFVRLSEIGPVATAFYRIALALPALGLWLVLENRSGNQIHRQPQGWSDYWRLGLAGLFFAADLAVWHWSIVLTSVANATLLANAAPVFVTLGGWLIWGHRFSRTFLIGMTTALMGMLVLMGESFTISLEHLGGDGLGLLTAVFYASYILSVGRLRSEFSTATIMAWSGVVSAAALLPLALLSGDELLATSAYGWAVLLGLALLSHAGGQSLIAYALAHLPAAFSSVGLLLQPVTAALLAWLLLGEPVSIWQAVGGVVILYGIFLARRGSR